MCITGSGCRMQGALTSWLSFKVYIPFPILDPFRCPHGAKGEETMEASRRDEQRLCIYVTSGGGADRRILFSRRQEVYEVAFENFARSTGDLRTGFSNSLCHRIRRPAGTRFDTVSAEQLTHPVAPRRTPGRVPGTRRSVRLRIGIG
jgi:hypothetical protein